MSMHTTQEWAQHAHYNMYQAQHAHKKAEIQKEISHRAHSEVMSENISMYNELHASLEQKVATSQRLLEKLMHRAESVDTSLQHTRHSFDKIEQALAAKEAPMQLCMWRMEQRERRPLREQVRDAVEVALEVEKATLLDAQRKLKDALKKTKATIQVLQSKLEELRHDISQKSQALSVDEMCLRTTTRSFDQVAERSSHSARPIPPPGSPSASRRSSSRHVSGAESSRNEVLRQQEAVKLNQSAVAREEAAKALREDSAKMVARCERAAQEALAKSERSMKERINDNQQMRRRLESELRQTCEQIDRTKYTINETKTQIRNLEEPMELTSTCASWRKQRATKEHILDPVTTALQEHQMVLLKSHEELKSHHQSEKGCLQELQEKRDRLKEDLRDKTAALHIDLNCMTHEATQLNGKPAKMISKNKLPRAMKVDPSFIPNPGHNFLMAQMPHTAR